MLKTLATILGLASLVRAQTAYCDSSTSICATISVPEVSASSTTGDIHFNITAPTTGWSAFGFGSQMAGSLIFVVYADGTGNVTVSPRLATGEQLPNYYSGADVKLLAGSGVVGKKNVAIFSCGNCWKWDGSTSIGITNTRRPIIHSQNLQNTVSDPTSPSATFQQHEVYGIGSLDLSKAVIPVPSVTAPGGPANSTTAAPPATTTTVVDSSSSSESFPLTKRQMYIVAHGVIMSISFLLLLPLGASFIRFFLHSVMVHAGLQLTAFLLIWAAIGLGFYIVKLGTVENSSSHHAIGILVGSILVIQAILGYLHHSYYKKHQQRGIFSYAHIWLGRVALLLGIINGGLGLRLVSNISKGLIIAYAVVAGIVGCVYIVGLLTKGMVDRKRGMDSKHMEMNRLQSSGDR